MQRSLWKSLLTFVLVLVLTVGTVATLSMATAAKTETAPARYSQQVRETQTPPATELSADVPEAAALSPAASIGAFAMILAVPAAGFFLFWRSRRKGKAPAQQTGRRYSLKSDMTFQNAAFAKRV